MKLTILKFVNKILHKNMGAKKDLILVASFFAISTLMLIDIFKMYWKHLGK